MADKKSHRTPNTEFSQKQKHDDGNQRAETTSSDPDETAISDEAIERSMRVYRPEEAMDLLICGAPGRSASTEQWQDFLARMRSTPPTRATQRGIAEAERELLHRVGNPVFERDMVARQRFFRALDRSTAPIEQEVEPFARDDDGKPRSH